MHMLRMYYFAGCKSQRLIHARAVRRWLTAEFVTDEGTHGVCGFRPPV